MGQYIIEHTRPDVQLLREYCVWASNEDCCQNLQLCLLTELFNLKVPSSEKTIFKRKLESLSVFFIIKSS